MSLNINYKALTDTDLMNELSGEGYMLRWDEESDLLELFHSQGGYRTGRPYREESTGEFFNSIQEAHRYVFVP